MLVAFFLLNNIFLLLKNFPLVQFVSTPCGCIARYVFNLMSVQLTKTLHTLQCPSLLSVIIFYLIIEEFISWVLESVFLHLH